MSDIMESSDRYLTVALVLLLVLLVPTTLVAAPSSGPPGGDDNTTNVTGPKLPLKGWHTLNTDTPSWSGAVQVSPAYLTESLEIIEEDGRVRILVTDDEHHEPRKIRVNLRRLSNYFGEAVYRVKVENSDAPQYDRAFAGIDKYRQSKGFAEFDFDHWSTNVITAEELKVTFSSIPVRLAYDGSGVENETFNIPTISGLNGSSYNVSGVLTWDNETGG